VTLNLFFAEPGDVTKKRKKYDKPYRSIDSDFGCESLLIPPKDGNCQFQMLKPGEYRNMVTTKRLKPVPSDSLLGLAFL
jgi:hypothetical protein